MEVFNQKNLDNIKEVALACTGGGVRTAVNIGIIRGLEEHGIKINAISGASLGSSVAILYAMGYNSKEILELYKTYAKVFSKFSIKDYLCSIPNLIFRGGLKDPKVISKVVQDICTKNEITYMSDFKIPVIISALDITRRETIYFSSKELNGFTFYSDKLVWDAVKSSCGFPVVFIPNKIMIDNNIHHMMDGGLTVNTAVLPLKRLSDFVIGIGTKHHEHKEKRRLNFVTMIERGFQSMRRTALTEQRKAADLWIEIDVDKTKVFDSGIEVIDYCEGLGYQAIKQILENNN